MSGFIQIPDNVSTQCMLDESCLLAIIVVLGNPSGAGAKCELRDEQWRSRKTFTRSRAAFVRSLEGLTPAQRVRSSFAKRNVLD